MVVGGDVGADAGNPRGGFKRVGGNGDDGQNAGQPIEQPFNGRRGFEAGGQQNAGNLRVVSGLVGLQRAENHLAAVTGGDDERVIRQAWQVVLHLHGDDQIAIGQPFQPVVAVQHLGVEIAGNFFDGGTFQDFV